MDKIKEILQTEISIGEKGYLFLRIFLMPLVLLISFEFISMRELYFFNFFIYIFEGNFLNILSEYSFFFSINLLFLFLFNKNYIGYLIELLIFVPLGIVEYIKYSYRAEYVLFSDLFIYDEWITTINDVVFTNYKGVCITLLINTIMLYLIYLRNKSYRYNFSKIRLWIKFAISVFSCIISFFVITDAYNKVKYSNIYFCTDNNKIIKSAMNDTLYSFYKLKSVSDDEIVQAYNNLEEDLVKPEYSNIRPNVIVIMGEALWDISDCSCIEMSENPFDKLKKDKYSYGSVAVNVVGGSTHITEFEFLTGMNNLYMDTSCKYRDYFNQETPNINTYFKQLGYNSYFIHGGSKSYWSREKAYNNMGADHSYFKDSMKYQDMYAGYISDDAMANEIIYHYEQLKDENKPIFNFSVTIATHVVNISGKAVDSSEYRDEINVTVNKDLNDTDIKNIKRYVNGVDLTINSFEKLVEYFENQNEPTIIVMFGDHAPNFASYIVDNSSDLYYTPYVMWNNFNDEKLEKELNISYLSTELIKYMNLPYSKQNKYNDYINSIYPINSNYLVCNNNNENIYDVSKEEKEEYMNFADKLPGINFGILNNPQLIPDLWDPPAEYIVKD